MKLFVAASVAAFWLTTAIAAPVTTFSPGDLRALALAIADPPTDFVASAEKRSIAPKRPWGPGRLETLYSFLSYGPRAMSKRSAEPVAESEAISARRFIPERFRELMDTAPYLFRGPVHFDKRTVGNIDYANVQWCWPIGPSNGFVPCNNPPHTKLPYPNIPIVNTPRIGIPKIDVPTVHVPLPEINVPKVDVPKVDVPKVDVPKVDVPTVDVPKVDVPTVDVPKVTVPEVAIPDINVPAVDLPQIQAPGVTIPKITVT